jgi:hypothetical protein
MVVDERRPMAPERRVPTGERRIGMRDRAAVGNVARSRR